LTLEIEAKMKLHDREPVESRLDALDAERGPSLQETNKFFDTRDGTLRSSDQGLRVRELLDLDTGERRVVVTHKGPRAHGRLKRRTETELRVQDDLAAAATLFRALGFHEALSFEKRRRRYTYEGCAIELDTLPYLGEFIEIEGPSEERVFEVRAALQMDQEPLITPSYAAMLQEYLTQHGIADRHVPLEQPVEG